MLHVSPPAPGALAPASPAYGRLTTSVLLVTADPRRRESLSSGLSDRGHTVVVALDEVMVGDVVAQGAADVILIDDRTPDGEGLDLCRRLALTRSPPVILLTSDADETDRVIGLEVGADDCLPQACSLRELAARIRALTRRAALQRELDARELSSRFVFAGWRLSLKSRELRTPDGRPLFLAANEISLLQAFVENPREVLTRKHLKALLGDGAVESPRMVDWRVHRLRAKLEEAGGGARLIKTVPRQGYMFDADVRFL